MQPNKQIHSTISAKIKLVISLLAFFLITGIPLFAQNKKIPALQTKWINNDPFYFPLFVKNEGQFFLEGDNILFGHNAHGVTIYLTTNGIIYRHDHIPVKEEKEREEKEDEEKEMKERNAVVTDYVKMKWESCNTHPLVIESGKQDYYFTYPSSPALLNNNGIKAAAFKKILYKDVYPGIDFEFFIPENSDGIKYNIILNAGADPSQIKMNYKGCAIKTDDKGNIELKTPFGKIIDHAPKTFYAHSGKSIQSSFSTHKNHATFQLENYDISKTVIIDPWIATPTFTNYNNVMDVEGDRFGNIYAYGGAYPFQEIKYNSAGVTQWVFSASSVNYCYGDFAIDPLSGISYLAEGFNSNPGARIIKVSPSGAQIGLYPGYSQFYEIWRLVYDNCTKQIIAAGGGTSGPTYRACVVDTNMSGHPPLQMLPTSSPGNDIGFLAIDNSNMAYFASTQAYMSIYDNYIINASVDSLDKTSYMVKDNMDLPECNGYFSANGFNGISVTSQYLYIYNGYLLEKRNKVTGALIDSFQVTTPNYHWNGYVTIQWQGLTADDSGMVILGKDSTIQIYNSNYNLLSATPTPDWVMDVKRGGGGLLYACGKNFVAVYEADDFIANPITLTLSNNSCSATVNNTGNLFYSWNPGGQTTATATGLTSGIYTVTVADNGCVPSMNSATVQIINAATIDVSDDSLCLGETAQIFVTGGTSYSWNNGMSTSSIIVNPQQNNFYSVSVTAADGCKSFLGQQILVSDYPIAQITATDSACAGDAVVLFASGGSNYSWNNGENSSAITDVPAASQNYSVIATNAFGCTDTASHWITINPLPVPAISGPDSICMNDTLQLIASGGMNYLWSNGTTTSALYDMPQSTAAYYVVATNEHGCIATATKNIIVIPLPVGSISGENFICKGSIAHLTATGGTNYNWSHGENDPDILVSPLSTTNYSVTIANENECHISLTKTIVVGEKPLAGISGDVRVCMGEKTQLSASGGDTYLWSTGQTTANIEILPELSQTISVVAAIGNCYDTTAIELFVNAVPEVYPRVTINSSTSANLVVNQIKGSIQWFPSDGLSCDTCFNTYADLTESRSYCAEVTNEFGCADTACISLTVSAVYIPNAFTPNENGLNEVFKPVVSDVYDYEFSIYNRWGEKLFQTNNGDEGWNGMYKGRLCEEGVYTYKLNYARRDNKKHYEKAGFVLLLP
jgi:gliding motility-associated-like protein